MSGPEATAEPVELDERGRLCPLPVISLARAAAGLPAGAVIRLLADDPAAALDVPAWCRMRGHQLLAGGDGRFLVRVGGPPS
ncbi:MAG TPA: sulfurtransferase TusA family protein [Candidatus Nanopelagicales bacterium]|nr:sulfurtransferase TusA family protein [Candidatus Nanopelagicales bacterium]